MILGYKQTVRLVQEDQILESAEQLSICSVRRILLLISLLAVAESKTHPDRHRAQRRQQHDEDRSVQRPLRIFGSGFGRHVAHRTALRENRRDAGS
jgi:hypothetical protein